MKYCALCGSELRLHDTHYCDGIRAPGPDLPPAKQLDGVDKQAEYWDRKMKERYGNAGSERTDRS